MRQSQPVIVLTRIPESGSTYIICTMLLKHFASWHLKGFLWEGFDAQAELETVPMLSGSLPLLSHFSARVCSEFMTSLACYLSDCADTWMVSPGSVKAKFYLNAILSRSSLVTVMDQIKKESSCGGSLQLLQLVLTGLHKTLRPTKRRNVYQVGSSVGGFCFAPPTWWKVDTIVNCGCAVLYTVGLFVGYGHANIRGLICDLDWRRAVHIESIKGLGLGL